MLQWWSDAGVDCLIDEAPRDWLRPEPERTASVGPAAGAPEAKSEILPDQLELFRAFLDEDTALPFHSPAAPRVCPAGDPTSGLMVLSDMPATEDCGTGILLSGASGLLFEKMLAAIGRNRSSIYLAALSCLRSPSGNFTQESAARYATLARHH